MLLDMFTVHARRILAPIMRIFMYDGMRVSKTLELGPQTAVYISIDKGSGATGRSNCAMAINSYDR